MAKKSSYDEDIEELSKLFSKVDVKNPESIQKWFSEHSYLSTADHARIANRSNYWIRELKRLANIKSTTPKNIPKPVGRKAINTIIVPENWDTEEWLSKVAKTNSVMSISKAVGISRRAIYTRLKRYNIKPLGQKSTIPKNPCYSHRWCYEHYITRGWSQAKCAKAAGICQQAFSNWLIKFKIPVRSKTETIHQNKDVKIWVRRVISDLEKQEIVRTVKHRINHIHVRFMNFFWETYYIDKPKSKLSRIPHSFILEKENSRLTKIPATYLEYEHDLESEEYYPAHITLRKKDWDQASFLEKRLALHEFTRIINRRGWIWPKYPKHIIQQDFDRLRNSNQSKYINNGVFTAYPRIGTRELAGFRLVEHFFGVAELWEEVFKSPKRTMKIMNQISKTKTRISFHNIIRFACVKRSSIKIYDPSVFNWIFKRLGITGTVLDLYPGNGYNAMACALAGLKYMTIPTPKFQTAIDNGFAEFIGLDYEPYDDRKVDLVLSNNDFKQTDIKEAMEYADKTRNIIHFVDRKNKNIEMAKYKPSNVLRITSNMYRILPDYLFIF